MPVHAVVFDYGKVISLPPEDSVMAELAALARLAAPVMEDLTARYRDPFDRGELDGETYYRNMLAETGVFLDDETIRKMVNVDLAGWSAVNGDTVKLMEDVKAAGLKLGILSNIPREFLAWARDHLPVFSLPDVGIFSCEAAFLKPEAAIYEMLIAALECEPWDIVFFDDLQRNVDGALACGIQAFRWEDPASARKILKGLGAPV